MPTGCRYLADTASAKLGDDMWRSRWGAAAIVVTWLVLSGVISALAPRPASIQDNRTVNNPPAAAESLRAQQILRAEFPDRRGVPALIVVARPGVRLSVDDLAVVHAITVRLSGSDRPDRGS